MITYEHCVCEDAFDCYSCQQEFAGSVPHFVVTGDGEFMAVKCRTCVIKLKQGWWEKP